MEQEQITKRAEKIPQKGFTHGGHFHADDVFGTALLMILNPSIQIERGFVVPEDYDGIVFDIGRGRFDHHQEDREVRENGIAYAAFGLLWRAYGGLLLEEEEVKRYDESFIQYLDESDNTGCDNAIADMIAEFNPGWDSNESEEEAFFRAVAVARQILQNHIARVQGIRRASALVTKAMQESDGEILLLPCFAPWKEKVIGSGYRFVIYPSKRGGYCVQGVPKSQEDRSLVCELPKEWWGQSQEELVRRSGIETITFCHASGFLASAKTLEDTIAIARVALAGENARTDLPDQ